MIDRPLDPLVEVEQQVDLTRIETAESFGRRPRVGSRGTARLRRNGEERAPHSVGHTGGVECFQEELHTFFWLVRSAYS